MIVRLIFAQVKVTFCTSENSLHWLVRCSVTIETRVTGARESCDVHNENVDSCRQNSAQTKLTVCVYLFFGTSSLCKNLTGALQKLHKSKSASAIVESHLRYAYMICGSRSKRKIETLQRLQNRAQLIIENARIKDN